ncbi:MAG TPA: hypothetical protein VJ836_07325 [Candidatus Saccharimonadales bacterium]|nr:hypothetical protein [Candidatus Saccharimonadales bacterium]
MQNLLPAAVNAYWFSFAFIGLAVWLWCQRPDIPRSFRAIGAFVGAAPLPAQLLFFLAIGFGILAPVIIVGYLFSFSIVVVAIYYMLVVLAGFVVLYLQRRTLWEYIKATWRSLKNQSVFALLVFVAVGTGAAVTAVQLGGYLADGTDSFVHMAKIQQIAGSELTIADGFIQGTVESRYHVNILHVLYAVLVRATDISVFEVWRLSYPFFLLAAYAAIYAIAWYFMPSTWKRGWPYLIGALSFLLTAGFWRTANYPNEVVLLWITIFIIGLARFMKHKEGWGLLVLGALLVAMTHPTYSLMAAAYLGWFILVYGIVEKKAALALLVERYKMLAFTAVALIAPVLFSLTFPNRMTEDTFNYIEPNRPAPLLEYGPLAILNPPILQHNGWAQIVLWTASIAGLVWLLIRAKTRLHKVLIATLATFYAVIAYNPLVVTVLSEHMPAWMIQRFSYLNRLSLIFVVVGLVVIGSLLLHRYVGKKWRLIVVGCASALLLLPTMQLQVGALRAQNESHIRFLRSLNELRPQLEGQTVFASQAISFMVPGAIPDTHVVWLPETNATPVANMEKRIQCGAELGLSLGLRDLRQAGVTRVLIGAWEKERYLTAKTKDYLTQIGGSEHFIVMKVAEKSKHDLPGRPGACAIPRGQ